MDAPKIVSQLEVVSRLDAEIDAAFATIEEHLPQLGHSEAKRLFLAATKYPKHDYDFSGEQEAFIRCYSASKNVKDSLVGMGVEVVIEKLIENQRQAQGIVPVLEGVESSEGGTGGLNVIEETKAAPKVRKTKKEIANV